MADAEVHHEAAAVEDTGPASTNMELNQDAQACSSTHQLDFSNLLAAVEELGHIADHMSFTAPCSSVAQQHMAGSSSSGAEPLPAPAPVTDAPEPAEAAGSSAREGGAAQLLASELAQLRADNERLEADRREMGMRLGEYRAAVAKLEGSVSSGERRARERGEEVERLKAECCELRGRLAETTGQLGATPERCRSAQQALELDADRARQAALIHEAQSIKLKNILLLEVRETTELRDFAEQERLALLEREEALEGDLATAIRRADEGEARLAAALSDCGRLSEDLSSALSAVAAAEAGAALLREQLAAESARAGRAEEEAAALRAERDAAAANLLKAEGELAAVGEYSSKMFRQVRFISHLMEKHSAFVARVPELSSLAKNIKVFVSANARGWEVGGGSGPAAAAAAAARDGPGAAGVAGAGSGVCGGWAAGEADASRERDAWGGGGGVVR